MSVTTPCPRLGQPDCRGSIIARDVGQLAKRKYCSNVCAAHARIARGIVAPKMPRAYYVAAGSAGGCVSGIRRRKRAALRAAQELRKLIPPELELSLNAREFRRVVALLVRAWRRGHTAGRSAARMTRPPQKGQAA